MLLGRAGRTRHRPRVRAIGGGAPAGQAISAASGACCSSATCCPRLSATGSTTSSRAIVIRFAGAAQRLCRRSAGASRSISRLIDRPFPLDRCLKNIAKLTNDENRRAPQRPQIAFLKALRPRSTRRNSRSSELRHPPGRRCGWRGVRRHRVRAAGGDGTAARHGRRPERRRHPWRDGHGNRTGGRRLQAATIAAGVQTSRAGAGDDSRRLRPAATSVHGGVSGIRNRACCQTSACEPATTGTSCVLRAREAAGFGHRRAGRAGGGRRSRGPTFGTALTREQIEALSDDPDELRAQLQDMAGPGAVIRVDSFEGGALPPKAQIKSIHITRDAFAAENHIAGGLLHRHHHAARRRAAARRRELALPRRRR